MRDEIILIKNFEFIDFIRIKGFQQMGSHGYFQVSGHIHEDKEQEYINLLTKEIWTSIEAITYENKQKKVFSGLVIEADIQKINGVCLLTLTLATGSYLMDQMTHLRSFQDSGITYEAMMKTVITGYKSSKVVMNEGSGSCIPGFLLQYEETDWEYAQRLASHFSTDIYPDSICEGVKISFGIPEKTIWDSVETVEYSTVKRRNNTTGYLYKSREIYHLGNWITLNGIPLWIMEISSELVGSELYHTYYLINRNSFRPGKRYNETQIGASLKGNVTAVQKDQVQISLDNDENADSCGRRWFTYATPYSSPDGTGWYFMPETGDKIRLMVPCEDETKCYVENAVHLESSNSAERINPDFKSIMNKQGKEILFTPNSLIMTNNAGMSIEILDQEGIKILSDKSIVIKAAQSVEITSAGSKTEIYAKEDVLIKQGNIQMNMSGNLQISGGRMKLN